MDIDTKRDEIRKEFFATEGMIIVSVLGIIGLVMVRFSGIFDVMNYDMLYDCVAKNGLMIIFGAFFFAIFLYCWILFLLNIIIPPRKGILYLNKVDGNEAIFLNKNGKKYIYLMNQNQLGENAHYNVLKSHNYVYDVLEKTNEEWIPKEKKSYWLNYYSSMGYFEDLLLLPIVYVILLPGILSILMSKGYEKLFGVIFCIVPLYEIIHDLIWKIKIKKYGEEIYKKKKK